MTITFEFTYVCLCSKILCFSEIAKPGTKILAYNKEE